MAKVSVNGCELYYEVHGQGDPLVLIMGLRRNVEWWYRQIPALSEKFQVIAFDNRGAGRSDKPAMEYSIRLFADDTAGLMDALDISEARILGISMGGYIAQELALNYPTKVNSLVLGCTGCGGDRAVIMTPERMEKFTANKGLNPEEILGKDGNLSNRRICLEYGILSYVFESWKSGTGDFNVNCFDFATRPGKNLIRDGRSCRADKQSAAVISAKHTGIGAG